VSDPWRSTRETFAAGLAELVPLLERHGFGPTAQEFGKGSGGPFAEATFARDNRSITLWLRSDSLSVIYRCDNCEVDHLGYMRQAAGVGGRNEFPTYSENALGELRRAPSGH
jgi:hypothetical protein